MKRQVKEAIYNRKKICYTVRNINQKANLTKHRMFIIADVSFDVAMRTSSGFNQRFFRVQSKSYFKFRRVSFINIIITTMNESATCT